MARHNPNYDGDDYPAWDELERLLMPNHKEAITEHITKLHLEPGDIILITDVDILDAVITMRLPISFPVPIMLVPEGGLSRCNRSDLLSMLALLPEETPDA